MRVLVYPHSMELGGSQMNAIQLAAAVRDRGNEVIVFSEPGPLVARVQALGLEHVEMPLHRRRPSMLMLRKLVRLVREREIDVVHCYEWPPIIEAYYGLRFGKHVPVVGTVMAMSVAPFLPRMVPLTVGTEQIRIAALAAGHRHVSLLEPPVDTEGDSPSVDGGSFRLRFNIQPDEVMVAMICRLVPELKLEGLLAACDAVGGLALAGHHVRLMIVGDGRSRKDIAARAATINEAASREVVLLAGEMDDPRPAYAAADITIGQGGSALRGMAFGKPLIVIGERGFSEVLTPSTAQIFLRQGWYGLGPGSLGAGSPALRAALEQLVKAPDLRCALGAYSRQLVLDRFSLRHAAQLQEQEYLTAMRGTTIAAGPVVVDIARSAIQLLGMKVRRKYQRWRGNVAIDDSNALSIVAKVLANGRKT